jgi:hypothetical protein
MKVGWLAVAVAGSVASLGFAAGPPTYRVLRVKQPPTHRHAVPEPGPVVRDAGPAQPYAYGWFGVPPRQHWSRHFGFYRNYTQWSAK